MTKYTFDTEDYNSPQLLEQDEMNRDLKLFEELQTELTKAFALYKFEMKHEDQ